MASWKMQALLPWPDGSLSAREQVEEQFLVVAGIGPVAIFEFVRNFLQNFRLSTVRRRDR